MRIKDNDEFYDRLHELEDADPEWFVSVGEEIELNHFTSPDRHIDRQHVSTLRKNLKQLRQLIIKDEHQIYNHEADKIGLRLLVTLYQNYGLNTTEICQLLKMKPDTLNHQYPPLKSTEMIKHVAQFKVVLRDRNGHRLVTQEGD